MRLLICACVLSVAAHVSGAEKKFELPKDPNAAVVVMEYAGGFTPPRKTNAAWLTIRADGRVEMPDRFGNGVDFKAKVSQKRLQELLRAIVNDADFFSIDPEQLAEDYQAAMNPKPGPDGVVKFVPRIADAPTTEITVNLKSRSLKVSQYALSMYAKQFDIDEMKQLASAADSIKTFADVTRAGGPAQVMKYLKAINAKAREMSPQAPKLTIENLTYTNLKKDGTKVVNFMMNGSPQNPRNYVRGAVTDDGKQLDVQVAVKWEKPGNE